MKIMGPDVSLSLSYTELPIGATQIGPDPNTMKTGTWRFVRPVVTPKMPPCTGACPVAVDIRGFIELTKNGLIEAALESYLEENPFPAILGRVCMHPCETACNRGNFDEALSINGLENYIGDSTTEHPYCNQDNGKKIVVIGSGPSGLSCAYFLKRLGYSVKIFEKDKRPGGILRYGIPEYRLPKKILDKEIKKLASMGIDIQVEKELGINFSFEELKEFNAIFIATGVNSPVDLDVPGIESEGVIYGQDFLRKVVTGEIESFEKKTIVIGGGNAAIDVARTVLRLGGKPEIYYRRSREEMPAIENEITDAEKEGVEIHPLTTILKVLSGQNKVTGAEFIRNAPGAPEKDGRHTPIQIEGTNYNVEADVVILATGEQADLSFLGDVLIEEDKLIKINDSGQSSDPKVFAGGDVTHYDRSVVNAIKDGKRAAIGIDCYLQGLNETETRRIIQSIGTNNQGALSFKKYIYNDFSILDKEVIPYEDLNTYYFKPEKRKSRRELPVDSRIDNFYEVRKRFSLKSALKEAERCFTCGFCKLCYNCFIFCPDGSVNFDENKPPVDINLDYCKGCGICAQECPTGVMRMVQEE
jgi:NADPH-dependent glutamate synthase beta subunit-like oxidoreductase/Pyruvate/2-oxoacid:ferredoxin oxidoreductase delta subunit